MGPLLQQFLYNVWMSYSVSKNFNAYSVLLSLSPGTVGYWYLFHICSFLKHEEPHPVCGPSLSVQWPLQQHVLKKSHMHSPSPPPGGCSSTEKTVGFCGCLPLLYTLGMGMINRWSLIDRWELCQSRDIFIDQKGIVVLHSMSFEAFHWIYWSWHDNTFAFLRAGVSAESHKAVFASDPRAC